MDPWQEIAHLNPDEIRDLQNRKLKHFISRQLYPFSAHYRKVFDQNKINPANIRCKADLAQIPFTSKLDFIDPQDPQKNIEFVLRPDLETIKKFWPIEDQLKLKLESVFRGAQFVEDKLAREYRPVFMTFTTGTTNKPVSYLYSQYDMDNLNLSGYRMFNLMDIKKTERLVNMFPFAPHLAFWQVAFAGLSANALIFSTGGGKVMGTDGNIAAIRKLAPTVIVGVPSYIYHVLRQAREDGCQMPSIKKIVLGASRVVSAFKLKLAQVLQEMGASDVQVFGTYGFTESRCAWCECPSPNGTSSGYHLYPDKEIFEIIDPKTGQVKDDHEDGELVYTSLDSRASSVIRFRTGDYVKGGITWEPCPHCHRSVPRLSSDITRISDVKDLQITKIKGSLVNFNDLTATLTEFKEIEEWQIEICKKDNDPFEIDELHINLAVCPGVNQEELVDTIKKRMVLATEVCPNQVNIMPMKDLVKGLELETANKEKRIIDRRPKM